MAPECLVPVGDGALAMCWVCAHMVTQHDAKLGATARDCGCSSEEIYPHDYRAKFARPQAPVSGEVIVLGGDLVCDHPDSKQCSGCRALERSSIPRIVPESSYTKRSQNRLFSERERLQRKIEQLEEDLAIAVRGRT